MFSYSESQRKAIETTTGNLQIIACAGSGKTQIVSQRIVNLLKAGVAPGRIIAFTYTEKAAAELQERVLRLCREQLPDATGLAEMYIGTIHAWCLKVLQTNVYEYQKFSVLDDVRLKLFVDRSFNEIGMRDLNMERFKDTGYYVQLMAIIRESELVPGEQLPSDITSALQKYEQTLISHYYLDFTMIMTKALYCLRNDEAFRMRVKKDLGYLIVDEYQDVNPVQEGIVGELIVLGANVCVVGDDDQTIFQWRGSSIDYIQHFRERYSDVHYIALEDNFRSSNALIDVALKCVGNNTLRLPKQMQAKGHQLYERGDILYNQFQSVDEENQFIISSIRNLRGITYRDTPGASERGLDYGDFVVLIRKWRKANALIEAFQQANLPFVVSGVNNLFQRIEVKASRAIFQYIGKQIDAAVLKDYWNSVSNKLTGENLEAAIRYLDSKRPTQDTYYERFNLQQMFFDFLEIAGIREDVFKDNPKMSASGYRSEEIVFYNLGMFSQVINDFETVYFKTPPIAKLDSFLTFLIYSAEDYYPEGWLNNSYKTPNAIRVMTIYQAKGLEFPVVFIPGLNKNYLPTNQPTGKQVWHFIDRRIIRDFDRYFPHPEDERRLLYVAITRSQKFLLVSRAPDGRQQAKESMFGPELRRSEFVISSLKRDWAERERIEPKLSERSAGIGLTFSLLKAYFDCPYSFKFWTFYGFEPPRAARIGFGAAIHHSLMELHQEFLEGRLVQRKDLSTLLERHKNFPYATEEMIQDMTKRAIESLDVYYLRNVDEFQYIEYAEKEIQVDLGDGIVVTGQMDLIKKRRVEGGHEKTIIDFKSTEDAQAYNASIEQLQLYALGYKELTGEIPDFLQIYNLDTNDATKNEFLSNELEAIRSRIINAGRDIRDNRLDIACNRPGCVCRFARK